MPLNPGDLMFVGWDSDNDDIAFVTTVDLPAGEVIFFTDDEWDGTEFNRTEQYMEWTVPTGGVSAGTVVTIDMDRGSRTATIDAGGALDYMRGGYDIAQGNEMFWAFQGTRTGNFATPDNFIAVIGNEDNGNSNQSPNLSGTGLTTTTGAIIIDGDEDFMEFDESDLPSPVTRNDLIAEISDLSNWTTADGGGNNNPNPGGGFDVSIPTVVCFANGARIATPHGLIPVENLTPGMLVLTRDNGPQPIRWTGHRRVRAFGRLAPIAFATGALGNAKPFRVSPQHRMLIRGWTAQLHFGEPECLVPAKALVNGTTIRRAPGGWVTYHHLLLDRHEILDVEGCPTESLFLGHMTANSLTPEGRDEVAALFPDLPASGIAARSLVAARDATVLAPRVSGLAAE
ncbi:MAG: Hint domain-containing protein [Pseudomonadota bacterium]